MQIRDDPVTVIVSKPHDVTEAMTLGKAYSMYLEILTDDGNALSLVASVCPAALSGH